MSNPTEALRLAREALTGMSPFVATEVVESCNGNKCRERWCCGCSGEDEAQRAVSEAIDSLAKTRQAINAIDAALAQEAPASTACPVCYSTWPCQHTNPVIATSGVVPASTAGLVLDILTLFKKSDGGEHRTEALKRLIDAYVLADRAARGVAVEAVGEAKSFTARLLELQEKAGMPWRDAMELAASEMKAPDWWIHEYGAVDLPKGHPSRMTCAHAFTHLQEALDSLTKTDFDGLVYPVYGEIWGANIANSYGSQPHLTQPIIDALIGAKMALACCNSAAGMVSIRRIDALLNQAPAAPASPAVAEKVEREPVVEPLDDDARTFGLTLRCEGKEDLEVVWTHAQAQELVRRFASHGVSAKAIPPAALERMNKLVDLISSRAQEAIDLAVIHGAKDYRVQQSLSGVWVVATDLRSMAIEEAFIAQNASPAASPSAPAASTDQRPAAWVAPGKDGLPNFGANWIFSKVRNDRATMPLYAAPAATTQPAPLKPEPKP